MASLYKVALEGSPKGMPPKGGRADLADAEVRAAVDHMATAAKSAAAKAEPAGPGKAESAPAAKAPAAPPIAAATTGAAAAEVNAFNRLLRPLGRRNAPPTEDGIHDPAGEGTGQLQPPLTAFSGLPRSSAGNQVNWVAALDQKRITPRWDRNDAAAAAVVMDLNIVREVKGSMPDVVYPHKQHTEWLESTIGDLQDQLGLVFHRLIVQGLTIGVDVYDELAGRAGAPRTVRAVDPFGYKRSGDAAYPQQVALSLLDPSVAAAARGRDLHERVRRFLNAHAEWSALDAPALDRFVDPR